MPFYSNPLFWGDVVENISIFEFLGVDEDILYVALQQLQIGDTELMQGYEIRRTDKFYEIENDVEHLGFRTIEECYRYLQRMK